VCRRTPWGGAAINYVAAFYHYLYHRAFDNFYDNHYRTIHHLVHDYLHNVYCPADDGTCDHDHNGCPYNDTAADHDDAATDTGSVHRRLWHPCRLLWPVPTGSVLRDQSASRVTHRLDRW
jgi:hypothetical protein